MLQAVVLGGLEFSPLVVYFPIAFLLTALSRFILHRLDWHDRIWRVAWFEVSLFVCYLALTVYLLSGRII
ncbi:MULTISPECIES: DUF1656 domain-containing protein [Pseudoalteromonas]|jgi:uncharacterized membrane protein|uniref:DUF1656 domain-containing protein n=3 Tax=Pseudoalteromonas TaxID=53246 RepID=Q3IKA2_PSET1|nr:MULTISPECIES: DUF1656 domain-containing protein [Pseudoalteromonas]ALS32494.1 hypothetical protein PTRA_a1250 [Pseudoalteromonas translucida KMM 520]ASM53484.1 hypothetical protein PNIG_a1304 [Pseudoalteromonas nigrifaciens]MBB1369853.1 DUF1656 domain-containing protein [Pseudoalteromonas sp. SR45-4]MBB1404098.1 DUF1656 domain-containing protein [Pseudoalteromonas sp. SG44-5]MBE0421458.1 DUF1656 domain-containing protein [Pseudoalteromonas nigrifaciens]|tara:strand:+ start:3968 stop:4177 length:210 start_codon:yes stop_codon:yes gene_type:complete